MPKSNSAKVCSICGKSETANWARHWKRQHPGTQISELLPGETPSEPFDENWLFLLQPLSLRELVMTPAKFQDASQNEKTVEHQDQLIGVEGISFDQKPTAQYIEIDVESDDDEL